MTGKTNAGAEGQKWSIKEFSLQSTPSESGEISNSRLKFDVTDCKSAEIDLESVIRQGTNTSSIVGLRVTTDNGYDS